MNSKSLIGAGLAATMVLLSNAIVFGGNGMSEHILSEPKILAFNMFWAAAPFIIFAILKKRTRKRAIGTGLALTALAWIYVTWDGWSYIALDKAGGANIGLGIIMILWPLIVLAFMMILTIRRKWELPHDAVQDEGVH